MSNFTLTASYNWIAQDKHYWDDWECAYMSDISMSEMRYDRLKMWTVQVYDLALTDTFNQLVETPYWLIGVGGSKITLNATDKSATLAGATRMEFIGDTTGVQHNYFFNSSNVYHINGDISSILHTVWHTAWTVTASCISSTDILFAVGGVIYNYDTLTNTIATACDTLIAGCTVKYLYFYNDMVVAVTTKGSDTIIYQIQYEWAWTYTIYSTEHIKGRTCVGAIWDSGIVYWITTTKIFGFQAGSSQEIRYIWYNSSFDEATFTATPKLAFTDGYLLIWGGTTLYRWWAKSNSRRKALSIQTLPWTLEAISGNYYLISGTTDKIYGNSSKYPDSGYKISLPYDAGIFWDEKTNLAFQIGYQLETWTSITVGVMTDEMQMDNTSSYVTVATITDATKKKQTITVDEINQALQTANYNSDWNSIRFKVTLNGAGWSSWLRDYTPYSYEIKCIHNFSNNDL